MQLTSFERPRRRCIVMKYLALGEVAHAAHAQFLGTTEVEGQREGRSAAIGVITTKWVSTNFQGNWSSLGAQ